MSDRFLKYIPSPKAQWLRKYHRNAYLLLSYIAEHARRTIEFDDGLEIGDAIIGNYEDAGLTWKEYRNARDKLIELNIIISVWNPKIKSCQKRAIKRAIKSEVVNLLNSDIWDINPDKKGDQKGNQGAIKGQQTRTKKNEKEVLSFRKENETNTCEQIVSSVSFPFLQKKENEQLPSDEKQSHLVTLGFDISEKCVQRWIESFGETMFCQALEGLQRNKTTVRNHEAWMERTLQKIKNKELNLTFLIEFKSKHNIDYLDVKKNYCKDLRTGRDFYYHLPHENFVSFINELFENLKEPVLV